MRVLAAAALVLGLATQSAPAGWRALQLESFDVAWRTIDDTFYDPEFGGVDWAAVRDELRPRVVAASSPEAARTVIREMLSRLGRSHVGLLSEPALPAAGGGPATAPATIRVADGAVIVTAAGNRGGQEGDDTLRPGDRLLAVDGESVEALVSAAEGPDARTRALDAWRRVDARLRGRAGSRVTLRVRRPDGRDHDVTVTRQLEDGEPVRFGNLPVQRVRVEEREALTARGRRVGVIAFNIWLAAVNEPVALAVDRFRDANGLVFDLRGNPGGIAEMIRGMAGHVIDEPVILGRMRMRNARLEFPVNPRRVMADGRPVEPFDGPVAILVDSLTGSTSECFAGALQSLGRARVFGRPTLGMALPALTRQLPSGDILMYAIGDFETATGRSLEGAGVTPDELVPLVPERLALGVDPDLEAALRWIDGF